VFLWALTHTHTDRFLCTFLPALLLVQLLSEQLWLPVPITFCSFLSNQFVAAPFIRQHFPSSSTDQLVVVVESGLSLGSDVHGMRTSCVR